MADENWPLATAARSKSPAANPKRSGRFPAAWAGEAVRRKAELLRIRLLLFVDQFASTRVRVSSDSRGNLAPTAIGGASKEYSMELTLARLGRVNAARSPAQVLRTTHKWPEHCENGEPVTTLKKGYCHAVLSNVEERERTRSATCG